MLNGIISVHMHVYVHVHIHACTCIYTCMYMYIYMHVHVQVPLPVQYTLLSNRSCGLSKHQLLTTGTVLLEVYIYSVDTCIMVIKPFGYHQGRGKT